MPVIPAGFGQINIRLQNDANLNPAEVTLGFEIGAGTPSVALCNDIYDDVVTRLMPFTSSDLALNSVSMKIGPTETGPSYEYIEVTEGGDAGLAVPANTALLVRKVTALGGRAGRGRLYWPGVRESRVDSGGNVDGTFVTDFQVGWTGLYNDLLVHVAALVVLHGPDSPLSTPTPIEQLILQSRCATQRRRMR